MFFFSFSNSTLHSFAATSTAKRFRKHSVCSRLHAHKHQADGRGWDDSARPGPGRSSCCVRRHAVLQVGGCLEGKGEREEEGGGSERGVGKKGVREGEKEGRWEGGREKDKVRKWEGGRK